MSNKHIYGFNVRVLVTERDEHVVAHALELDLLGYGDTLEESLKDLTDHIIDQVSLCQQLGQPESVFFDAPRDQFDRWDAANKATVVGADNDSSIRMKAICITIEGQRIDAAKIEAISDSPRFEEVAACA